jgi:S1-C subfamily serine protease
MKPRPIYSSARKSAGRPRPDSGHGIGKGANVLSARAQDPLPAQPPAAPSWRIPRFLSLPGSPLFLLIAVLALALILGLAVYFLAPRRSGITQKEIDSAVKRSLESAQPAPSRAAVAYEAVKGAVVKVRRLQGEGPKAKEVGVGSGVVITDAGLVMTNYHVISEAPRLSLVFFDGSESDVEVVNADPDRDLALLRALHPPDELQPANLRSVAGIKMGDEVFAVGFPFGLGPSLSAGVVSGLERSYVSPIRGNLLAGLIQFDAASNPGNSGGPLLDRDGDVVGLVTSILNPSEQHVFIGIAFAVPIEQATRGFALNPF